MQATRPSHDESYFVSMTDLMVGVLFIFIIMLLTFALQLKETTDALTSADATRSQILEDLARTLKEKGIRVELDQEHGVLRLPEEILFASGRAELNGDGRKALAYLAAALRQVLPCYAFHPRLQPDTAKCSKKTHLIETIYIEGHTDRIPIGPTLPYRDNWDLSAQRAANTYRALVSIEPALGEFRNAPADSPHSQPLFSIAGYGPNRPVPGATGMDEASLRLNRRIDIRIVMASPKPVEIGQIENIVAVRSDRLSAHAIRGQTHAGKSVP